MKRKSIRQTIHWHAGNDQDAYDLNQMIVQFIRSIKVEISASVKYIRSSSCGVHDKVPTTSRGPTHDGCPGFYL